MRLHLLTILLFVPLLFGFSDAYRWEGSEKNPIQLTQTEPNERHLVFFDEESREIQLCNLEVGQTYYIQMSQPQPCSPYFELDGVIYQPHKPIQFEATSSCQSFTVNRDYLKPSCDGGLYLTVMCTTCNLGGPSTLAPPIIATPGVPAQALVENVFIGGGCFDVTNVTYSGDPVARGQFFQGGTSIGLESGMVLSTGNVTTCTGPNNQTGAGSATSGGSDPDLQQAAGGTAINDAAILEFDFQPTLPQITFRYVFASEEYCDFANTTFNDAFGFFLSGPGISGPYSNNAQNIALIPGTPIPVSINNVNHINNPMEYIGNIPAGDPQLGNANCAGHPVNGTVSVQDCQFDGYTRIFTAVANVIPCETYHIKLAIGDGSDSAYDSAVFLEANSFDAGGQADLQFSNPITGATTLFEGCNDGFITFFRSGGDPSQPITVNYTLSGTATNGVDHTSIPASVTIPPNSPFVQIPISAFDDGIAEGTETIIITLDDPCNCSNSEITILIEDVPDIEVTLEDVTGCAGLPILLEPTVSGGNEPYFYQWSNGSGAPVYFDAPFEDGIVSVTVTDLCGNETVATANVDVYDLEATISGDVEYCQGGDPAFLDVTFSGEGPWNLTYTIDMQGPFTINNITDNPYQLEVTQPGEYQIVAVTNADGCFGFGDGIGNVVQPPVIVNSGVQDIECNGDTTGSIDLTMDPNYAPYDFAWGNGANTEDQVNLPAGDYPVTVTTNLGCESDTIITINEPPLLEAETNVISGVDCTNPTGGAIDLTVQGGAGGYTFIWNTGSTDEDITGLSAGVYSATITDGNGCVTIATDTVPGDNNVPTATIQVDGDVNCLNQAIVLDGTGSTTGTDFAYIWSATNGGQIIGDNTGLIVDASGAGTYELLVTDTVNGCFTIGSVTVLEDVNPPLSDAGLDSLINCFFPSIVLDGTGSSTGNDFSYVWTTPDGNIIGDNTILTPEVDAPGTYQLVVTDASNGCTDTSAVLIDENFVDPIADAGPDSEIDCFNPSIQLDGSGSSTGPGFTLEWTTPNGNIVGDNTIPNPIVDQEGTYNLLVTNQLNGCSATTSVEVTDLSDIPPVDIAPADLLTCGITEIQLDATGSASGPSITYTWSTLDGNIVAGADTPTPTVDAPGTYELEVLNTANGCSDIATVVVDQDLTLPVVDPGAQAVISCTVTSVQLDGSGSSAGPQFTYQWQVVSGTGTIVNGANGLTPEVDGPGIFELTVTNTLTGCISAATVEVIDDADSPIALATPQDVFDCLTNEVQVSGVGSSIGGEYTYNWTTNNGSINAGNGTLFLTVGSPGDYTLTVVNTNNGCEDTVTINVPIDTVAPLAIAANPADLTCVVNSISLDGTGSSAGPEFTYLWSTGDGNIVDDPTQLQPTIDAPGTYELVVTNTQNGCTNSTEVIVLEDIVPPVVDAGPTTELNCQVTSVTLDGSNSSAGPTFDYLWTTANGNIVSGENTLAPSIDAPGTYQLEITNTVNGCVETASVTITEDVTLPVANAGPTATLTCATTEISLDGSGSSAGSGFSYAWSTPDGSIVSGANTVDPVIDAPGTYEILVTNTDNLCQSTAQVVIDEDIVAPVADGGPPIELDCGTISVTLDGSNSSTGAEYTYSWSTQNGNIIGGLNTITTEINSAGTYTLTVENTVNGCVSTSDVVVTLDADAPNADAGTPQTLTCAVTEVTLDGSGSSQGANFSYLWEGSSPGTNIVSGATTLNPVVNAPGTYQLTVTNLTNDCQTLSFVTIDEDVADPVVDLASADLLTCAVTSLNLDASGSDAGPNFTYTWTTLDGNIVAGGNTANPLIDQPGTYSLEILNTINGCSATDALVVSEDLTPPDISLANPDLLTCAVTSIQLDGNGSSTGSEFTYQWSTSDGQILADGTTLSPTVGATGTYELLITNTDNGCTVTASVVVDEDVDLPLAEAGTAGLLTCVTTSIALDGSGSDQGPNFSYNWSTTNGQIDGGANTLFPSISAPGTYTLTVENTFNGCVQTDVITVDEDITPPVVVIGNPDLLSCLIDEATLDATGSDAGSEFAYDWSTLDGVINDVSDPQAPIVGAAGTYLLTITNTDNGCTASSDVTVLEDVETPSVEAGPGFVLNCNAETYTLQGSGSGTGAVSYAWSTNNGNIQSGSNSANPVVDAPGVYFLEVTNELNGCTATDEVIIEEENPEAFFFTPVTPICNTNTGGILFDSIVGGVPPYVYSIDGGASFSSQPAYFTLAPGDYNLAIQDANGCEVYDEVIVPQGLEVVVNVEPQVIMELGDSYQLGVQVNLDDNQIDSILWTPPTNLSCTDCLDPVASPVESIDYTVTVISPEGCEGSDRVVFIVDRRANIYVPNIFSPNGDGENDVFYIFADDKVQEIREFMVFNRWGESVHLFRNFLPNDPAYGWDGNFRGVALDPAVFTWYAEIEFIDGRVEVFKGDVTLVR
jgi:gliding motility-associated-like protein